MDSGLFSNNSLFFSCEYEYANRYSSRKQSAGLEVEEPGTTEDFFAVDEIKSDGSCKQENLANENESTSLGSSVHEEAREDAECECT